VLDVARLVRLAEVLFDLLVRERAAEPRRVPSEERHDDEEHGHDDEPPRRASAWRRVLAARLVRRCGALPVLPV
jgi:hypothetical protein